MIAGKALKYRGELEGEEQMEGGRNGKKGSVPGSQEWSCGAARQPW